MEMTTKPKINKKSVTSLWFDQDKGFIFFNNLGFETIAGFQCTFSYNVFYGEIGYLVLSIQENFSPESENEIIVFLEYNEETNKIIGKYSTSRPSYDNENRERLFYKIKNRFNESIDDLNCGYSIEF